jgi:hypothetical protein
MAKILIYYLVESGGRKIMDKRIYWQDMKGKFQGGYFVRSDLFKSIKMFEEKGYKVVGISVDDSWNIEFICEEPKEIKENEKTK